MRVKAPGLRWCGQVRPILEMPDAFPGAEQTHWQRDFPATEAAALAGSKGPSF